MEVQALGRVKTLLADLLAMRARDPGSISEPDERLISDLAAIVLANAQGLTSLDYARDKARRISLGPGTSPVDLYHDAYFAAAVYVERMISKIEPAGLPDPSAGVFRASVALERLPGSLLSAHLLFALGHGFEGHAVCRLMLEQVAWALAVSLLEEPADIDKVRANSEIGRLTKLVPPAGRMYGSLSKRAHVDATLHRGFFVESPDGHRVVHAEMRTAEYAGQLLMIADVFGIVLEVTQADYIKHPETVTRNGSEFRVQVARPFFREADDIMERFEAFGSG